MESAGLASLFPMEKLAVRGYAEVLRHYRGTRWHAPQAAARPCSAAPPQLFIGVDAPDFNLGLEARLKRAGIPVVHYVSPSIWAWRGGRIAAIARSVDHMLTLFPFEPAIYRNGRRCRKLCRPSARRSDSGAGSDGQHARPAQDRAGRKVFALLPGSRQSELRYMADTFIATAKLLAQKIDQPLFLVPLVSRETREMFEAALYRGDAGGIAARPCCSAMRRMRSLPPMSRWSPAVPPRWKRRCSRSPW